MHFDFGLVDEMQKYAYYSSYDKNHNIPKWLFEILREYDENMKAKFLFYTLGSKFNLKLFVNLSIFRLL